MIRSASGGGVIIGPDKKVLVVSQHGTSWSLPKGVVEEGEDERIAAARETKEESGVTQLDFIKKLGIYQRYKIGIDPAVEDKSELKTITIFLYTTKQRELAPEDPHNPEARWVDADEVEALLTHPKDKAFFAKVLPEVKDYL